MKIEKNEIETRDCGPCPEHLIPAHYDRFQAAFKFATARRLREAGMKGSPLGRGFDEQDAIDDLLKRTNAESRMSLSVA